MKKIHLKTLKEIFQDPVIKSLEWRKIESLLCAIGAKKVEGAGSRVKFELNNVIASFHRPHPQKEAKPYQVKDARNFLLKSGANTYE